MLKLLGNLRQGLCALAFGVHRSWVSYVAGRAAGVYGAFMAPDPPPCDAGWLQGPMLDGTGIPSCGNRSEYRGSLGLPPKLPGLQHDFFTPAARVLH